MALNRGRWIGRRKCTPVKVSNPLPCTPGDAPTACWLLDDVQVEGRMSEKTRRRHVRAHVFPSRVGDTLALVARLPFSP